MLNIGEIFKNAYLEMSDKVKEASKKVNLVIPSVEYHIHFGAGKIGLGLVVRKFLHRNLIIIQHDSEKGWGRLQDFELVKLFLNKEKYLDIPFIHQKSDNFHLSINENLSSGKSFLICTSDKKIIRHLLKSATSISTALGNDGLNSIKDILTNLKTIRKSINLYPFENDVSVIDAIKNKKLNVIYTTVDKICMERIIIDDMIKIKAENYELVYLLDVNRKVDKEISTERIIIKEDKDEYNFFHNKKLFLVNGIHLIAVIFGYRYLAFQGTPLPKWGSIPLNVTIGAKDIIELLKECVKVQSLRLIHDTKIDTLKNIYKTVEKRIIYDDLISFGNSTVTERFNFSFDYLERIFKIDVEKITIANLNFVEKRIKDRIQLMIDFIQKNDAKDLITEINNIDLDYAALLNTMIEIQKSISTIFIEITKYIVESRE